MREKKNKLVKNIKEKIDAGEEMSEQETTDLATKWMDIADVDGSGTIDIDEFKDMVSKLDESISADKVKELFVAQDGDGSGELSVEKFGVALHEALKMMKEEEGGEDEDN